MADLAEHEYQYVSSDAEDTEQNLTDTAENRTENTAGDGTQTVDSTETASTDLVNTEESEKNVIGKQFIQNGTWSRWYRKPKEK